MARAVSLLFAGLCLGLARARAPSRRALAVRGGGLGGGPGGDDAAAAAARWRRELEHVEKSIDELLALLEDDDAAAFDDARPHQALGRALLAKHDLRAHAPPGARCAPPDGALLDAAYARARARALSPTGGGDEA